MRSVFTQAGIRNHNHNLVRLFTAVALLDNAAVMPRTSCICVLIFGIANRIFPNAEVVNFFASCTILSTDNGKTPGMDLTSLAIPSQVQQTKIY
jgi:hypothetical protein